MDEQKKTISLALGSGGARGLAHIGAIRCLIDNDYEIGYIAGTSIGALIGGIYAADQLSNYEHWARELDRSNMIRLLDFSFTRGGIIKGDRVIDAIRGVVGDKNIEELAIGYTAVATDMRNMNEVWLSKGSLFQAIRASVAIPTLMSPAQIDGRVLADGGLVNPLPIAPTLNHGASLVVAIDLSAPAEGALQQPDEAKEKPAQSSGGGYRQAISAFIDKLTPGGEDDESNTPGFLEMSTQTIEIMQSGIARLKLAAYQPDFVISMPRDLCRFWEFDRADELIDFGYQRTQETIDRYQRSQQ